MTSQVNNRLLILTSTFPRWKNDTTPPFVKQFAESLRPQYKDIFVLAPHAKGAQTKEVINGVTIYRFHYLPARFETLAYEGGGLGKIQKSPLYLLKLLCFATSFFLHTLLIVIRHRVRLLNAHWIIPQGLFAIAAAKITRVKVAVTVHGGDIFALRQPFFVRLKHLVLKHADAVLVNSSATKEACAEVYGGRNYPVIPMGIDTDKFTPAKEGGAASGEFRLLFVGRLTEEKGVIYLCQAMQILAEQSKDIEATIIGEGPEKKTLERYVEDNGLKHLVHFTGWVDNAEVTTYYQQSDVFVGPSIQIANGWKEALGLVFIEALATGTPVVASRIGGVGDVVKDGESGYLVKQRSPEQIAEKVLNLKASPKLCQSMGKNGRRHVEQRFSWRVVSESYGKQFDKLISKED